ncbi:MAG: four helix bundle protein [Flavobacteriaceae bacterium]
MHRYKELNAWKQSRLFCTLIYQITEIFPQSELFGLTAQLRRASISISSNIAEGASRSSNKEFCRFLEIAIGSAYEVETQLIIATDLNFLSEENSKELLLKIELIIKMLSKLKSSF